MYQSRGLPGEKRLSHWKQFFDSRSAGGAPSNLNTSTTSRNYEVPAVIRATKDSIETEKSWATVLIYALIRSRHCEATNLEDKVYSLLGLIQSHIRQAPSLICPQYGSDCSPANTYLNLAIQLLRDCEDLLVLSCVEGFRNVKLEGGDLPSWVPDWSIRKPLGLRVTGYKRYRSDAVFFLSCPSLTPEEKRQRWPATVDEHNRTVTIRGVKVDKISFAAEPKLDIIEGNPFPRLLEMLLLLPDIYEVTGEGRLEAFWRTLLRNTADEVRTSPIKASPLEPSFMKWLNEGYTIQWYLEEKRTIGISKNSSLASFASMKNG
ncbi:hypothetical protein F53441_10914 [Fusarium austroafricanum]|uniref:Uncharacterized protein n=1 Tax=Fusarium austroafricanum TaxID=2364996 RepID=A0A8H4NRU7_9HYPO|nr:hypothetical protein F53441_10914 [Fusarium austroafricanum]